MSTDQAYPAYGKFAFILKPLHDAFDDPANPLQFNVDVADPSFSVADPRSALFIPPAWANNPLAEGAMANWRVNPSNGAKDCYNAHKKFFEPRRSSSGDEVLFIAGTAECWEYWEYTAGAHISGLTAAGEVLHRLDVSYDPTTYSLHGDGDDPHLFDTSWPQRCLDYFAGKRSTIVRPNE
jgi:hypothetical protein